jgi:hypothetical protein
LLGDGTAVVKEMYAEIKLGEWVWSPEKPEQAKVHRFAPYPRCAARRRRVNFREGANFLSNAIRSFRPIFETIGRHSWRYGDDTTRHSYQLEQRHTGVICPMRKSS